MSDRIFKKEEKKKLYSISAFPTALLEKLEIEAIKKGMRKNHLIFRILEDYFSNQNIND